MFRIHEGVDETAFLAAIEQLRQLGRGVQGLERWDINKSIDTRKGRIILEEALFTLEKNFRDFQETDAHRAAGEVMAGLADWWVVDYL